MSARQKIASHQSENEWYFCSAVFAGEADIARQESSWLSPSLFVNRQLGQFWEQVLDHGDAVRAGNDLNLIPDFAQWINRCPNTTRTDEYARAISEDSYLRKILGELSKIATEASKRDVAQVSSLINGLKDATINGSETVSRPSDVSAAFKELITHKDVAVKTGLSQIDNALGGFFAGELTLLATRPGMGKTQLSFQIARMAVEHGGHKAIYFSLEMDKRQLWARAACPLAGLEWKEVRAGNVTDKELEALSIKSDELAARLGDDLIIVDDAPYIGAIHRICAQELPDFVVIDQLPEVLWFDPDEEPITWYGKACKYIRNNIAKSLGIAVMMNHQINRAVELRKDKHPVMADLRDSGELEQRSDLVLLGYRDDYYYGRALGQSLVPFELNVGKHRQGSQDAQIFLDYDLKQQWFR